MKFTVWYKTELGAHPWTLHGKGLDEETASYQAMNLLKDEKTKMVAVAVAVGVVVGVAVGVGVACLTNKQNG